MDSVKLLKVIKALIKEEVKSSLNSVIKERVEFELNKILAEKFLSNMSGETRNINERQVVVQQPKKPAQSTAQINEARRVELLRKMGVENNPIFEDVDMIPDEDEDEGIDLSQFGIRSKL